MFSTEIWRFWIDRRSRRASRASWIDTSFWMKRLYARILRRAPSSSRTLERTFFATKKATSSGISAFSERALLIRMATRISSSGGSMANVKPESKREIRRSWISARPFKKETQNNTKKHNKTKKTTNTKKNTTNVRSL